MKGLKTKLSYFVLLPGVIWIWGSIFFRPGDTENENITFDPDIKSSGADRHPLPQELDLNYRDPFTAFISPKVAVIRTKPVMEKNTQLPAKKVSEAEMEKPLCTITICNSGEGIVVKKNGTTLQIIPSGR